MAWVTIGVLKVNMEAELSTSSLVNPAPDFSYILNALRLTCGRLARYRQTYVSFSVATTPGVARAQGHPSARSSNRLVRRRRTCVCGARPGCQQQGPFQR